MTTYKEWVEETNPPAHSRSLKDYDNAMINERKAAVPATDEWLIYGVDSHGYPRRFVIHHDPSDQFSDIARHAMQMAGNVWGLRYQILSLTNQGTRKFL